jgi:hypothetical protein
MAKQIPRNISAESSRLSPVYPAGVYRYDRGEKEDPRYEFIIARDHPRFGTVQADALVQVGYEFVRDATAEELQQQDMFTESVIAGIHKEPQTVPKAEFDKLNARLEALENSKGDAVEVDPKA